MNIRIASGRAGVVLLFCMSAAAISPTPTFTTLLNFDGTNGAIPLASLIQGTDGYFYGTTYGVYNSNYGTIFKISSGGALTTLYNFCSQHDCADGAFPSAALVQATNGNFYGTTPYGGIYCLDFSGCGTTFRITSGGAFTSLHSFSGGDGSYPFAALVQGTGGSLYGTTSGGFSGSGTVFKMSPAGTVTAMYWFGGGGSGYYPAAPLVQGTNGSFYGTTSLEGAYNLDGGTVFKITPAGGLTTLHSFDVSDGNSPAAGLVQSADGSFYGTTEYGGDNGFGTLFKISAAGNLKTLHSFNLTDGASPVSGLVQATDGNFYGTTEFGGDNGFGAVFEMTPDGTLTTLHNFELTEGAYPTAGLVQGTDGSFYGTTSGGGASQMGTVFNISTGLGPFVKTLPSCGKAGATIKILGTDLTGVTSVIFNGTAAVFAVVTNSGNPAITAITATVPAGASSGKIQVVVPGGTLQSDVAFHVLP